MLLFDVCMGWGGDLTVLFAVCTACCESGGSDVCLTSPHLDFFCLVFEVALNAAFFCDIWREKKSNKNTIIWLGTLFISDFSLFCWPINWIANTLIRMYRDLGNKPAQGYRLNPDWESILAGLKTGVWCVNGWGLHKTWKCCKNALKLATGGLQSTSSTTIHGPFPQQHPSPSPPIGICSNWIWTLLEFGTWCMLVLPNKVPPTFEWDQSYTTRWRCPAHLSSF